MTLRTLPTTQTRQTFLQERGEKEAAKEGNSNRTTTTNTNSENVQRSQWKQQ